MASLPISNPYGTLGDQVSDPTARNAAGQEEASPLLGRKPRSTHQLREWLKTDVSRKRADVVLLLSYVITGLLDSASISTWGAFVSMQTGNTVYLGLGLTAGTNRWKKSGISILAFCLGSFIFSRFHREFSSSPKQRWVLCLSSILQVLFIIAAATILTIRPSNGTSDEVPWNTIVPIALIAFQSCGQAVVSRALKYNAFTSVVLTSIYCDLFSDAALFDGICVNAERNRRLAAPIFLLIGALCGGVISNSSLGAAGVLWVSALLKFGFAVVWLVWPAEAEPL
ncbi:hypothetical protein N7492_003312 [Penicillium capsulatum]|uniref:DUF1275 domain protein n=1 Tax=Penicillium capsulatum TaxID=69766 RepID=A0A9W9ILS6_9EURO|nr:hypothetical protein N7492_003312 [Penicillium capsulatum]KAJ6122105.1 hypothetical protein N7512_004570 [Penicillium capsulatum]